MGSATCSTQLKKGRICARPWREGQETGWRSCWTSSRTSTCQCGGTQVSLSLFAPYPSAHFLPAMSQSYFQINSILSFCKVLLYVHGNQAKFIPAATKKNLHSFCWQSQELQTSCSALFFYDLEPPQVTSGYFVLLLPSTLTWIDCICAVHPCKADTSDLSTWVSPSCSCLQASWVSLLWDLLLSSRVAVLSHNLSHVKHFLTACSVLWCNAVQK